MGCRLGGASTKTLEGDTSAERSGTAFLGKEQDAHKHGGARELEKTGRESLGTTDLKSAVLGGGFS